MPKDWLETLEAVRLTNADLLRRYACLSTHCYWKPLWLSRACLRIQFMLPT